MVNADAINEEQKEILSLWQEVLKKKSSGVNFRTKNRKERAEKINRGVQDFLDQPSKDVFKTFWNELDAAQQASSAERVYRNNQPETLQKVLEEMENNATFKDSWQDLSNARKVLWELFAYLHFDDSTSIPPINTCSQNGLEFFGVSTKDEYKDTFKKLKDFSDSIYVERVGHATKNTDHEIPVLFEVDQLFNVVDKVKEDDISEADDPLEKELYEKILIVSDEDKTTDLTVEPGSTNYWKISPGSGASKWDEFREGNYIAIGWNEIDFPEKDIREEIEKKGLKYDTKYVEDQFEYFVDKMKQGDIVLSYGGKTILGVGKIEGGYYKEEPPDNFQHRRDVNWLEVPEFPAEELGEDFYDRVSINQTIVPIENDEFIEKIQKKMKDRSYFWLTTAVDDLGLAEKIVGDRVTFSTTNADGWERRVIEDIQKMKEGDKVIGYHTGNKKPGVWSVLEVQGRIQENEEEIIEMEISEKFNNPVQKEKIVTSSENNLEDDSQHGKRVFEIDEEDFRDIVSLGRGGTVPIKKEIPAINLSQEVEIEELYFPPKETARLKSQVSSAIENGKYIILIGPPGTGKSKLAKEICNSYVGENYQMVTANSDWSTFDTIGGYHPEEEGSLQFQPGIFLESFKDNATNDPKNEWLILDEINRADIDKAFGALFSALTGDKINLSFKADNDKSIVVRPQEDDEEPVKPTDHEHIIPKDWRLIATMNTYDKTSLYEMSYAFMRRFAFIPVPAPKEETIDYHLVEKYLDIWGIDDRKFSKPVADLWGVINRFRKVGPATIEDIYKTLLKTTNGVLDTNLDYSSALIMHVLPQFEGLLEEDIADFIENLDKLSSDVEDFGEDDVQEISDFAAEYFQINREKLPTPAKEEKSE